AVEAHAEEILFQWIIFENQANPARRESGFLLKNSK
ncbi:hypothetical protein pipiens_020326, partial [Culex pipiens pipiens]